jgi:hypothetical protein
MDGVLALAAKEIMAIPVTEPRMLFSSPQNVHAEYKRLARRWHPDLPRGDEKVMSHINTLHDEAERLGGWSMVRAPQPPPASATTQQPFQAQPEPAFDWIWTSTYGLVPAILLFMLYTGLYTLPLIVLIALTIIGAWFWDQAEKLILWGLIPLTLIGLLFFGFYVHFTLALLSTLGFLFVRHVLELES